MLVTDLIVLFPILIIGAGVLVLMLAVAWGASHCRVAMLAVLFLLLGLGTIPSLLPLIPHHVTPLLMIDGYGAFFMVLILGASLAVTVLAYPYWNASAIRYGEFYLLMLLATLGAEVLVTVNHFASLFLGLELLSVSLYGMVAYARMARRPLEAGIKYLILSAAASTFVLFGMAVLYFDVGTLAFPGLQVALMEQKPAGNMVLAGFAMILIGMAFKLGLVPFHMWTPDVYEGAPVPVSAFIATVSKGAVIGLFLRMVLQMDAFQDSAMMAVLSGIAIASMFVGNWSALLQENIKRLLAYSSIAHMGYVMVAFLASGGLAVEAVGYYLVAYIPTMLGAFGVVQVLSRPGRDADSLEAYRGLLWRNPGLAIVFIIMMFSLAGIPFTAGFLGKFYIVTAGLTAQLWILIFFFVLNSVIGLFYYLRLIRTVISDLPTETADISPPIPLLWTTGVTLGSLTLLVVWLGIYPDPIMRTLQSVGEQLTG
jgi:NADH-quinone oxidoreductase subunit N